MTQPRLHPGRRTAAGSAIGLLLALCAWLAAAATPAYADHGETHTSSSPAAGAPALSAPKTSGLDPAGENVTVTGAGFNPGVSLFVAVCDPAQPPGRACDMANFKQAQVDDKGAFTVELRAMPKFGTTDCLATACAVQTSWVQNPRDASQSVALAIGFTGGAPARLPATMPAPAGGTAPQASPAAPAPSAPAGAPSAAPVAADEDKDDDGLGTGAIVGIVAAIVIVAVVVAVALGRRRTS